MNAGQCWMICEGRGLVFFRLRSKLLADISNPWDSPLKMVLDAGFPAVTIPETKRLLRNKLPLDPFAASWMMTISSLQLSAPSLSSPHPSPCRPRWPSRTWWTRGGWEKSIWGHNNRKRTTTPSMICKWWTGSSAFYQMCWKIRRKKVQGNLR